MCLPSDALSQHLPSSLRFSCLGHGVSLHGCSSKAQPLLLTLDQGCLLTAAPPDLERGVAPLGPPAYTQPPLLGCGVAPTGRHPWPWAGDSSCTIAAWHSRPPPLTYIRCLFYFTKLRSYHEKYVFCGIFNTYINLKPIFSD